MKSARRTPRVALLRLGLAIALALLGALIIERPVSLIPSWTTGPAVLVLVLAIIDAILAAGALIVGARKPAAAPRAQAASQDEPGSDTPITNEQSDKLHHLKFAYVLARHIAKALPPTTIGIHGKWGTGKTSLGNLIIALLEPRDQSAQVGRWAEFDRTLAAAGEPPMDVDLPNEMLKELTVLRFNAWQYASADSLWRALILELARRVDDRGDAEVSEGWRRRLYYSMSQDRRGEVRLNSGALTVAALKASAVFVSTVVLPTAWLGAGLKLVGATAWGEDLMPSLSNVFEREKFTEMREQMKSIEEFRDAFQQLVMQLMTAPDGTRHPKARVVFFIDDLDRCLPTVALEIMETIKTFLDVPGCMYVLMCDQELLGQGVRVKFQQIFADDFTQKQRGREYMEKIIQVSFSIPPPRPEDLRELVGAALKPVVDDDSLVYFDIAHAAVGDNPRRLKRLCLGIELAFQMMRTNKTSTPATPRPAAGQSLAPPTLDLVKMEFAKVYCLSVAWPDAVDLLTEFQVTGKVPELWHPELKVDGPAGENLAAAVRLQSDLLKLQDTKLFADMLLKIDWAAAQQVGEDAVQRLNPGLHEFLTTDPYFNAMALAELKDYLLWTATLPSSSEPPDQSAAQSSAQDVQSGAVPPTSAVDAPTRVVNAPRRALKKK